MVYIFGIQYPYFRRDTNFDLTSIMSASSTVSGVSEADHGKKLPLAVQAAARWIHRSGRNKSSRKSIQSSIKRSQVNVGDVIVLQTAGLGNQLLISEGLHEDTVGVLNDSDATGVNSAEPELSLRRNETWFKVCPQLRYDMSKAAEKLNKDITAASEQRRYMLERATREEKENASLLLRSGSEPLLFGQILQLQHVKSGKFLTMASKKVAIVQKDCLAVELSELGSEASWFEISPRFKANNEGCYIFTNDQILLRPVKQSEYSLSHSHDNIPIPIAKHLCSGLSERKRWKEANLSIEPMSWRMELVLQAGDSSSDFLSDGQAITIVHPEVEGMLCAPISHQNSTVNLDPRYADFSRISNLAVWIVEAAENYMGESVDASPSYWNGNGEASRRYGMVLWGDRIRLRHLYSGRYLSVGNSSGMESLSVKLVADGGDDSSVFVITQVISLSRTKSVEHSEFSKYKDCIPLDNLSFCLEHLTGDFDTAHFHATSKYYADSSNICFTTTKDDQDSLVGTPVEESEVREIEMIKEWQRELMSYAALLRSKHAESNITHREVQSTVRVLIHLLDYCDSVEEKSAEIEVECGRELLDTDDRGLKHEIADQEIALANRVFTKPLSTSKISSQNRLSELNMFQVLFHIVSIPMEAFGSEWSDTLRSVPFRWAYFIHRLCFRCATAIFKNNTILELVFARSEIKLPLRIYADFFYSQSDDEATPTRLLLMASRFLACGNSAAQLVRQLVNNNEELLEETFDKRQVASLVSLIRQQGPKKRYLDLLSSICTCDNVIDGSFKCVVSNQELIVLEIFTNNPDEILIQTDFLMYSGEEESEVNTDDILGGQKLINGKGIRSGEILIRWESQLFDNTYASLGVKKVYVHKKSRWIALGDLCNSTEPSAERMTRYYAGLISLFVKMVQGRSYNAMMYLDRLFSYEMLLVAINSDTIPPYLRGIFCDFCTALYLNRYPHVELQVPRPQFFHDPDLEMKSCSLYGRFRTLPHFRYRCDPTHAPAEHLKHFFEIAKPTKFNILHQVLNTMYEAYLNSVRDSRSAELIGKAIKMSNLLLVMGFFHSSGDIVNCIHHAIRMINLPHTCKKLHMNEMMMCQEVCTFLSAVTNFQVDLVCSLVLDGFNGADENATFGHVLSNLFSTDRDWKYFSFENPKFKEQVSVDSLLVQIVLKSSHVPDPSIHLFEKALELLLLIHLPGTRLLNELESILIINSKSDIRAYKMIREKSAELLHDIQSYEIWGMDNEFSGLDSLVINRVQSTLLFLTKRCAKNKDQLAALKVIDTVYLALKIEAPKSEHLDRIKQLGVLFLSAYVKDQPEYQIRAFSELTILVDFLETQGDTVIQCLAAIVSGNRKLSNQFPEKVIMDMISKGLNCSVFAFFCQLCSVNGIGIKRNQDTILKGILSNEEACKIIFHQIDLMSSAIVPDDVSRLLVEFLSAVTRGRNSYSEAKVQEFFNLETALKCFNGARNSDRVLQCALLRFISDAYFDTGLTDTDYIQQNGGVCILLLEISRDLEDMVARASGDSYDELEDTLSNLRTFVFFGELFAVRAFFSHAFEFQTAPERILEMRQPLLETVRQLEHIARTPAELHLVKRTISSVRKSISGHLRKRKNSEERREAFQINLESRKKKAAAVRAERKLKQLKGSGDMLKGRPDQRGWRLFYSQFKHHEFVKNQLSNQQLGLLRSIIKSTGSYEVLLQFLSTIMNHVVQKCRDHLLQFSYHQVISEKTDRTAAHVLTISSLILCNAEFVCKEYSFLTENQLKSTQAELAKCGAIDMCFELLTVHVSDSLRRKSVETFIYLLEGGNREVQDLLYEQLVSSKGEHFFLHLEEWFQFIWEAAKLENKIEKRRVGNEESILTGDGNGSVISGTSSFLASTQVTGSASNYTDSVLQEEEGGESESSTDCADMDDFEDLESDEPDLNSIPNVITLFELTTSSGHARGRKQRSQAEVTQKEMAKDIVMVIRFLQLCMEGHNMDMQNFFRDQSLAAHKRSINFILLAVKHALVLTKNAKVLSKASRSTIKQISGILDFLVETMQGPCYQNQMLLANPINGVIEMTKKLLFTDFELLDGLMSGDISGVMKEGMHDANLVISMQSKASRVLSAMLEGQADVKLLDIFIEEIDPSILRSRLVAIHAMLNRLDEVPGTMEYLTETEAASVASAIDTLTVMTEMARRDKTSQNIFQCRNEQESNSLKYFNSSIRSVEIHFKGNLHQVFFVKPLSLNYLSHSTRVRLFFKVDANQEPDSRIKSVLEQARMYLDEAEHTEELSRIIPNLDVDYLRVAAFVISLMTNFLILLTVSTTCPSYQSVLSMPGEALSISLIYWFSAVYIGMDLVLLAVRFAIQVPINMIRLLRELKTAKTKTTDDPNIDLQKSNFSKLGKVYYYEIWSLSQDGEFSKLPLGRGFFVISVLLYCRFGTKLFEGFYYRWALLIWVLSQTFFFLRNTREKGGKLFRSQTLSLYFCAVYDVLADVDTIFQVVCLVSVWNGFWYESKMHLLAIPLFDIVLTNETLINVIRAVIVPFKSLTMTFILLAFTLYGFAFLTFSYLQVHIPDDSSLTCESLLECFLLVFDIGLRVGEGPAAVLSPASENLFAFRYGFDLLFVVLISIFLLNIVFGIIIDTFGSLREQQHDREDLLSNYCFICGLPRQDFDAASSEYKKKHEAMSSGNSASFGGGYNFHMSNEHNVYDYLGFIVYLERKDKTDFTGLESYVSSELEKGEYGTWLPHMRALGINATDTDEVTEMQKFSTAVSSFFRLQLSHIHALESKLDRLVLTTSQEG